MNKEEQIICISYAGGLSYAKIGKNTRHRPAFIAGIIKANNVKIASRKCPYCKSIFIPSGLKQIYCSIKCRKFSERPRYKLRNMLRDRNKRKELINYLGGKCVGCGITDWRILQVNHLNGGGRREILLKGNKKIYKEILNGQRENEFDLRCANCNLIYEFETKRRNRVAWEHSVPIEKIIERREVHSTVA